MPPPGQGGHGIFLTSQWHMLSICEINVILSKITQNDAGIFANAAGPAICPFLPPKHENNFRYVEDRAATLGASESSHNSDHNRPQLRFLMSDHNCPNGI